jgi:hypothetical protein
MKVTTIRGKEVILLTHKEKAKQLGISTKTLTRWKKKGQLKDISISLPKFRNPFYFLEGI